MVPLRCLHAKGSQLRSPDNLQCQMRSHDRHVTGTASDSGAAWHCFGEMSADVVAADVLGSIFQSSAHVRCELDPSAARLDAGHDRRLVRITSFGLPSATTVLNSGAC